MVMPSVDIYHSALRKAKRALPTKGIANIAKRERNKGAKQLDALMKELAVPLTVYIENFPKRMHLHPYERSLIELALGEGNYEEIFSPFFSFNAIVKRDYCLTGLEKGRCSKEKSGICWKGISFSLCQVFIKKGSRGTTGRVQGLDKLQEIFKYEGKAVDDLLCIAKTLRAMPVVDLEIPTLCLVGAPNVGKSSLVHMLSTRKPEVCTTTFNF
ncbi:hypothetical protein DITRI_Ditri18aG0000300 [Diplodiscus trichospermus]